MCYAMLIMDINVIKLTLMICAVSFGMIGNADTVIHTSASKSEEKLIEPNAEEFKQIISQRLQYAQGIKYMIDTHLAVDLNGVTLYWTPLKYNDNTYIAIYVLNIQTMHQHGVLLNVRNSKSLRLEDIKSAYQELLQQKHAKDNLIKIVKTLAFLDLLNATITRGLKSKDKEKDYKVSSIVKEALCDTTYITLSDLHIHDLTRRGLEVNFDV